MAFQKLPVGLILTVVALLLQGCAPVYVKPAPFVEHFAPTSASPGTVIFVDGYGFGTAPTVSVGNKPVTLQGVPTDEHFAFAVPSGATSGLIVIVNGDLKGASPEPLIVTEAPFLLTSFAPTHAKEGQTVRIKLANMKDGDHVIGVDFGLAEASFEVIDNETIDAIVPAYASDDNFSDVKIKVRTSFATLISTAFFNYD